MRCTPSSAAALVMGPPNLDSDILTSKVSQGLHYTHDFRRACTSGRLRRDMPVSTYSGLTPVSRCYSFIVYSSQALPVVLTTNFYIEA